MLRGKPLLEALNRMGCGGVILGITGEVMDFSPVAEHLLKTSSRRSCEQPLSPDAAREALKALLRASGMRFTLENDTWVVVERKDERPLMLHSIPLSNGMDPVPHT